MLISEKIKLNIKNNELSLKPSFIGKTMNIEITSQCNENCIYCQYAAQGFHKEKKFINEDFFYRITKEAKELGITDIGLYITGEPFMNPKLYDYVEYLKKELNFNYIYISTNGIMCTPENLERLVKSGIDSIKFSVSSSNKENFYKHHGIDAYNKVYENIKYASKYRKMNNLKYKLFIFSILTKFNINEKNDIIQKYSQYVDEIMFSNVISTPTVKGVKELLSIDNRDTLINEMSNFKLPCMQLFNKIIINEEGELCACCNYTRSKYTVVENLFEMSLKDAIYSKNMIELRSKHLKKDISGIVCENCIFNTTKNVKPLCDHYEKELLDYKVIDITDKIIKRFGL